MKTTKKNQEFIFVDEQSAAIAAMEFGTRFAKARATIQWLRSENLQIHWDLMWDYLNGGDLCQAYIQRFAKDNYLNINSVDVRNQLMDKFRGVGDAYGRYAFPQKYVIREEDGSFSEIDEERILEDYRTKYTYTFSPELMELFENVKDLAEKLGVNPNIVGSFFQQKDGKIEINFLTAGRRLQLNK